METNINQQAASKARELSRENRFVQTAISRCDTDKGFAARLRRADNPSTEYQSWDFLGQFNIDIENDYARLPYTTVVAAIARSKADGNGALACYDYARESEQAKSRLRRLLACNDLPEVCRVLRPLFALIQSKVNVPLDYVRLLKQLRFFGHRTKTQWAQEFYSQTNSHDFKESSE